MTVWCFVGVAVVALLCWRADELRFRVSRRLDALGRRRRALAEHRRLVKLGRHIAFSDPDSVRGISRADLRALFLEMTYLRDVYNRSGRRAPLWQRVARPLVIEEAARRQIIIDERAGDVLAG